LHCHTAAVDAPYLGADDPSSTLTAPLSSGGTQRDFVRDPVKVAGDFGALLVGRGIGVFVSAARRVNSEHALDEIEQRERVVTEREARCDQRERAVAVEAARIAHVAGRAAALWDRLEQTKADQERQPERHAVPPGEPSVADAALPGDPSRPTPTSGSDDTPAPSGDLHAVAPTDPERHAVEPDVRGEFLRRKDQAGGDPVSVPLSYVHSRDQAEFPDPELAKPPVQQQPISAGLDRE
jgi:hypothetical protein